MATMSLRFIRPGHAALVDDLDVDRIDDASCADTCIFESMAHDPREVVPPKLQYPIILLNNAEGSLLKFFLRGFSHGRCNRRGEGRCL